MEVVRGKGGEDLLNEDDDLTVMDERNFRKIDDHSSALAEKLLQGWTLLNEHCPQCLTPLVRNRQKKMYCAACRQWILTEAEAAAKALQQRVGRSDVAGQNQQLSKVEQSTTSASGAPSSLSHDVQNFGKGNGIGQLRLSLATGRAGEEKAQDDRNPKRFAKGDHGRDGLPRLALADGKENANQSVVIRPGVPVKSALVLQPTVNPVNDILVARRTLTTLNEKLEGIRQLISNSHDINELRELFAVLEECIHAIEVTRHLLKSVE